MTRGRRLVALLVGLLLALGGVLPAAAADDGDEQLRAEHVVVVGVPGLLWSDVDPVLTPQLWDLAGSSAIGALSVRAGRATTCLLDGWATLGAGNRARYPGAVEPIPPVPLPSAPLPDDQVHDDGADPSPDGGATGDAAEQPADDGAAVDASYSYCGLEESVADLGLAQPEHTVTAIADDEATRRFGAEPGLLGGSVGCARVVGRAALLAAAVPGADVDQQTTLPTAAELGTGCPLTLVSVDDLTDAGRPGVDQTDSGTQPGSREAALTAVDRAVGQLRAAVAGTSGRTLLVLAGISEVNDGRPRLHVAMAQGPGFSAGWLTSASTGRAPYVQLIDVAPTVLRALGTDVPASVNGQPFESGGARPALSAAVEQLRRADVRAAVHYRSTGDFFWCLVGVNAALLLLALLSLGGRGLRLGRRTLRLSGRHWPALVRSAALAVGALPVATYLASAVPWERVPESRLALAGSVLVADLLVTAVVGLGPWRRTRLGPAVALLAVTLGTLVGDVLTGSHLELNGLLGYDAIVAGRFVGYGNLSFGLYGASALLLLAAVATAAGRAVRPERTRAATIAVTVGLGLVVVGVDGAPGLGRDFGGMLSAVPGVLVLAMLLVRARVTVGRVVAIAGATAAIVGTVAVLDWLRPADQRTHLGRFVAQVLSGEAWTVVSRKGQANLSILVGSKLSWMLLVALVAAWWLLRPGGLLRSRPGLPAAGLPGPVRSVVRSGLVAVAVTLAIGALVNDSGVALPATAATLLVPLLLWLVAGSPAAPGGGPGTPGEECPAAGAAPDGCCRCRVRDGRTLPAPGPTR